MPGGISIKPMTMQLNAELINEEEVSGAKPHTLDMSCNCNCNFNFNSQRILETNFINIFRPNIYTNGKIESATWRFQDDIIS